MSAAARELLSPNSFRTPRGGTRKNHEGHTYMLTSRGNKGERYYKCEKGRFGCKGRLKSSPQKCPVVSVPHTCRGQVRQRANGNKQRQTAQQTQFNRRPAIPPEPRPGPSYVNDDEDYVNNGDEEVFHQDPENAQMELKMKHTRQKMEIGELMKTKLQLEIDHLRRQNRPTINPGANTTNQPNFIRTSPTNASMSTATLQNQDFLQL